MNGSFTLMSKNDEEAIAKCDVGSPWTDFYWHFATVRRLGWRDFSKGHNTAIGLVLHKYGLSLPTEALSEIETDSESGAALLAWVVQRDHNSRTCFYLGYHWCPLDDDLTCHKGDVRYFELFYQVRSSFDVLNFRQLFASCWWSHSAAAQYLCWHPDTAANCRFHPAASWLHRRVWGCPPWAPQTTPRSKGYWPLGSSSWGSSAATPRFAPSAPSCCPWTGRCSLACAALTPCIDRFASGAQVFLGPST